MAYPSFYLRIPFPLLGPPGRSIHSSPNRLVEPYYMPGTGKKPKFEEKEKREGRRERSNMYTAVSSHRRACTGCVCACARTHVCTCTQSCILACIRELLLGMSAPNVHPRARAWLCREKRSLTVPIFSLNKHSLTCSRRNVARTTEHHSGEATSTLFPLHVGCSLKGPEAWVIIPAPPLASSVDLNK